MFTRRNFKGWVVVFIVVSLFGALFAPSEAARDFFKTLSGSLFIFFGIFAIVTSGKK